ncbi:MAG: PEGA domain-containing protein [Myxococcota bacterium]
MSDRRQWALWLVTTLVVYGAMSSVTPALAQKTPKAYLLTTESYKGEVPSIVAPRVHAMLKERMDTDPRVRLADKYEAKPKGGVTSANAAVEKAKDRYNAGIGLLVVEDFDGSLAAFKESIDLYIKNLADVDSYEVFKDAHLRLALASFRAGKRAEGRVALKLYVSMVPEATFSVDDYPEEVVKEAEKAKKQNTRQGTGTINVTSTPSGADVLLNGELLGQTPLEAEGLPAGEHYLVVRGKGAFPLVKQLTILGRKTRNVAAELSGGSKVETSAADGPVFMAEIERRVREGDVDESMNPYLAELASRTGSTHVVFVIMREQDEAYKAWPFVFKAETGTFVLLDKQPFDKQLARVAVDAYKLSVAIIEALGSTPAADRVVVGNPFEAEEEAAAAAVVVAPVPGPTTTGPPTTPTAPTLPSTPKEPTTPPPSKDPPTKPTAPVVSTTPPPTSSGSEAPPLVVPTTPFEPGVDRDEPWYDSWWVWAGVGVVVVSAAVAGGYLLLDDDDQSQAQGFSATVSW